MTVFAIPQSSMAALPTKSAIKDAQVILRNALPIDNDLLRDVKKIFPASFHTFNLCDPHRVEHS